MSDWSDFEYLSSLGLFPEGMSESDAKKDTKSEMPKDHIVIPN